MSLVTDPAHAARLIADADPYTEFVLATDRHGRTGEVVLMARDHPRPGRRCTNLTHGTEWFDITPDSLVAAGFVHLRTIDA